MRWARPAAVVATIGLAVAATATVLTASPDATEPPPSPSATTPAAGSAGAVPPEPLLPANEQRPDVKSVAVQFVEHVGTWTAAPDNAGAHVQAAGYPPELASVAGPLMDPLAEQANTTVIYPQLGGLTPSSASVIVLARQELRIAEALVVREVALDIRLRGSGPAWSVTSVVDPSRPALAPARPGGPTATGRQLVAADRVMVPEPIRGDVVDRRLGDPVMGTVLQLARRYDIELQVGASGHPGTVFPGTHLSNHAVGRAVDVRAINGVRVADLSRDDPVLAAFMADAGAAGATEVGGPIALPGSGLFTDDVHQDHIHVGITPGKPTAAVRGR